MIYAFGAYELDTDRHELRHSGVPCPLEPQVFAVLHYLIEHRDRVVSKQDLLDHVWPDTFVSESALYQRLRAVRQAVGDSGRAQRVIKTVHKQGYRFSSAIMEREPVVNRVETEMTATSATLELPADVGISTDGLPSPPTSLPVDHILNTERKLLTVVCATLANAEVLVERLGFGVLERLQQTFVALAKFEVERYDGLLRPYGDLGFFALFGVPVSHEDHPRRAVLAALAIRQRLSDARAELDTPQDMHPMVRIGIHTGLVRLSESEMRRFSPLMGETMELAVRLQSLAGAGKILVSESTLQLVHGEVGSEAYGLVRGSEASESIMAYTVDALGAWHPLLHQHSRRVLSPFVGRQDELTVIERSLTQAVDGQGQVVGLMGDPGMGKSRFLYEFAKLLSDQPVTYVEAHCLSYGNTTPYLPLLGMLRQLSGITDTDGPESMRTKVHDYLEAVSLEPASVAPFLFELLGLTDDTETLAGLTPKVIKERTFDALLRLSLQSSQQQPLIMAVENLHWIDPTSEEWLASLVEHLPSAPLLLLTTYRPGYRTLWMDKSYATQLALSRLTPQDSRAVIASVLQTKQIPEQLVQEILTKAGGNPFFLEELSQAVVERGAQGAALQVPDTVQAVLAARIDRLPSDDKRLLQIASVIGKDVPVSILQAAAKVPETVVEHNLTHLQHGEFLHEIQHDPERVFTFKHALTQDVAYQSLLQRTRQQYHQQVARVLEAQFPDMKEMQPELLAHHYTQADLSDQALVYWHQAAQKASERAAYAEAISHVRKGLEVLQSLPDVPERAQQELILQLLLGDALQVTRGYTYPEVGHTYARARELCQQVGPTPHLSTVLLGLMRFGSNRGASKQATNWPNNTSALPNVSKTRLCS